jgi:hypothetical protein
LALSGQCAVTTVARSASSSWSSVRPWRQVIRRICTDCSGRPKPRSSKARDADTTTAGGDFGLSRTLASAAIDAGPSSRASALTSAATQGRPLGLPDWPGFQAEHGAARLLVCCSLFSDIKPRGCAPDGKLGRTYVATPHDFVWQHQDHRVWSPVFDLDQSCLRGEIRALFGSVTTAAPSV